MAQQQANQLRAMQLQQAQLEANRTRAMNQGRNLGRELFGHGTLPRLTEGRSQEQADMLANRRAVQDVAGQRSGGMQDIAARRYAGLEGFTAPENAALRQRAYEGFRGQVATGQRALQRAMGQNRVFGDAAVAGLANFQRSANAEAAKAERDLMIQNIAEKQNRLGQYEQSLAGMEGTEWGRLQQALQGTEGLQQTISADELNRQMYNNQQFQREKAGQLQAMLGTMGLAAGDWSTAARSALANQQMQGALNTGSTGGKGGK